MLWIQELRVELSALRFFDLPTILTLIYIPLHLVSGHPDKLTNPVPNSRDPNFNERFVFPIVTNDQQLRLLLRSRLQVTVVDMHGEEAEDPSDGLIGTVESTDVECCDCRDEKGTGSGRGRWRGSSYIHHRISKG